MKNVKRFLFLFSGFLLSTAVISCVEAPPSSKIFFGGQIVNPSSDYVTLYKDNKTIDSLNLNLNYRFFKYYDSLESGIYKVEHIPGRRLQDAPLRAP